MWPYTGSSEGTAPGHFPSFVLCKYDSLVHKVRWKSAAMASEITLVIQNAVALNHTCTLDALSSLEKTRIITILTFFHV